MPTQRLTAEILTAAIEGFESQKRRIDVQIAELRILLDGSRTQAVAAVEARKVKRRKMSAAARKRIGDAQRKRWAESKGTPEVVATLEAPKRKLSAAGRRAIAEATKKRWAAFHAAKKAEKPVVAKKVAAKKTARKITKKAPTKIAKKPVVKKPQKKVTKAPEGTVAVAG
jgi:hypothetical protein